MPNKPTGCESCTYIDGGGGDPFCTLRIDKTILSKFVQGRMLNADDLEKIKHCPGPDIAVTMAQINYGREPGERLRIDPRTNRITRTL